MVVRKCTNSRFASYLDKSKVRLDMQRQLYTSQEYLVARPFELVHAVSVSSKIGPRLLAITVLMIQPFLISSHKGIWRASNPCRRWIGTCDAISSFLTVLAIMSIESDLHPSFLELFGLACTGACDPQYLMCKTERVQIFE